MSRRSEPETTSNDSDGDLRELLGMSPRRAPAMLAVGQVIDDAYRIEEELGAGGMGRVYRARDLKLGRDVALKLHLSALAPDDDSLQREAMALARLAHPNVVTVHGVGSWSGHPWVAMEYVPGGTARSWLRESRRTHREILALYLAAGRGLAAAHAAGLVHRDFKPDNVLVGKDGRARVADFGLAREVVTAPPATSADGDPRVTFARGTPGYMAPEQRAGGVIDAAADQFAFAVAVWEALAGGLPFAPPTDEPDPGAVIAPAPGTLPRHVEGALRRALSIAPADRWQSLQVLLAELENDPVRGRRRLIAFAGAGVLLAASGWTVSRLSHQPIAAISCEPSTDELADVWSPARGVAIHPKLGAAADRVLAVIDQWATRWRTERRSSCEATHVQHLQSPALLDLRTACLDRARLALGATVDLIASNTTRALDAATGLPRLEDCADLTLMSAGAAPPTTPGAIASGASADALIARAMARREAGQIKPALAAAREAVAFADSIHLPGAQARARVELASSIFGSGKLAGVLETFEDAARFAAAAKDDALVAKIWINVLDALGIRLDKPGEAERLLVVAEAAVARVGKSATFDGLLDGIRGDLAMQRTSYAEAIPLLEHRIRVHEQAYGKTDPSLARWLNRLATALSHVRRLDEAHAHLDRAAAILEGHYGPKHPNLGVLLTTRAALEYQAGDYATSVRTGERALAIKEATLGANHPSLVPTLMNLALARLEIGENAPALAASQRGLAIAEATLPPTNPRIAVALTAVGQLQLAMQAWKDAETSIARALAILEPLGDHVPLDEALRTESSLRVHAKDLAGARRAAGRAVAIASAEYGDSIELVRAVAQLARVQLAAGDRAGARASFERAHAVMGIAASASHPDAAALASELARVSSGPP
ncbi:hypothetical protein BH11MYX3_BH11MYX3_39810 [soil metagenome]